jgi:glycosyltransferase involved in cell wall biosynthesis
MGRGAAILANDVPEHREVLGEAGWYYDRNDPDALAACLQAIVADGAGRREKGAAAAARSRNLFSWDRVAKQYEALFESLLQR